MILLLLLDLLILLAFYLFVFDEQLNKQIEEEKKGFKGGKPIL